MKKSVQLYSVKTLSAVDFEASIRAAAEIGYEGIEFAGFYDHSAQEVKGWLDKYGIAVSSAHVPATEVFDTPEKTIEFHKIIGNDFIICPYWEMNTVEDVKALADNFKKVAPIYEAAGMKLGYHNHDFEFKKHEGRCFIDIFAELCDVELEFDVYWVYRGGENPVEYLKKYSNRISVFHAKDGDMEKGKTLGTGGVDMKAVFETVKEMKLCWAVVESEATTEADAQVAAIKEDYNELIKLMK